MRQVGINHEKESATSLPFLFQIGRVCYMEQVANKQKTEQVGAKPESPLPEQKQPRPGIEKNVEISHALH